jgi:hypothetical protein
MRIKHRKSTFTFSGDSAIYIRLSYLIVERSGDSWPYLAGQTHPQTQMETLVVACTVGNRVAAAVAETSRKTFHGRHFVRSVVYQFHRDGYFRDPGAARQAAEKDAEALRRSHTPKQRHLQTQQGLETSKIEA